MNHHHNTRFLPISNIVVGSSINNATDPNNNLIDPQYHQYFVYPDNNHSPRSNDDVNDNYQVFARQQAHINMANNFSPFRNNNNNNSNNNTVAAQSFCNNANNYQQQQQQQQLTNQGDFNNYFAQLNYIRRQLSSLLGLVDMLLNNFDNNNINNNNINNINNNNNNNNNWQ